MHLEPKDDGACSHLSGRKVLPVVLRSTDGSAIDTAKLTATTPTVFFFFTRAWNPRAVIPKSWRSIPGATGEIEQTRGFRLLHDQFVDRGIKVVGVGSQPMDELKDFWNREHLPFDLLCDERFLFAESLIIPTFIHESKRWIKRMALFAKDGKIERCFYPVFPPEANAQSVLDSIEI